VRERERIAAAIFVTDRRAARERRRRGHGDADRKRGTRHDLGPRRRDEIGDRAQQRGLAAPRWTQQRQEFAALDGEVDARECHDPAAIREEAHAQAAACDRMLAVGHGE